MKQSGKPEKGDKPVLPPPPHRKAEGEIVGPLAPNAESPLPVKAQTDARIPALIARAGDKALLAFVNYFTAEIENDNTRAAYLIAWREFSCWTEAQGLRLEAMQPFHVAAYRKTLSDRYHARSVKVHLSALRKLFDKLVTDQVIAFNPAASVKSPRFSVAKGVTPVLSKEETRRLFDKLDASHIVGLRDRAILAVLVYTVGRVTAVSQMPMSDFFEEKSWWTVRLREKGGKQHEVLAHHNLVKYVREYIEAMNKAGLERGKDTPLLRSSRGRSRRLTERGICRQDVAYMIKRRCKDANVPDRFTPHSFRATGITLYMENGGALNEAQKLANHADPRTTKLYDRSSDTVNFPHRGGHQVKQESCETRCWDGSTESLHRSVQT